MNSMDRFKIFCLLCIKSSDWWAKEKECKDSEGKRVRSSVKVGLLGPGVSALSVPYELFLELEGRSNTIELARGTEGVLDEASEDGIVGSREGGCCLILRRPDAPRPCS